MVSCFSACISAKRLGDLAKLTWRAVNFETGEIAFTARKTGRRIVLSLVQPLSDYLASPQASDNPNAFIFPHAASAKRTASLSISRQYTHLTTDDKRAAMRRLPDVTNG